jgi:hypothetical protein
MTFLYQNSEGFQVGEKEHFFMLTGATLIHEMISSSSPISSKPSQEERELMQFLLPIYRAFLKNPPKLFMRLGSGPGRHSIHAYEKIEKGRVVSEYIGEFLPETFRPSHYRWGPIDALKYRNISGLIEDGFPNVAAFHLYDVDNLPFRVIFVAIEEILPGSMVTVNYGMNHSVKLFTHTEYQKHSLKSFFLGNPLNKIILKIKELRGRTPKELGWKRSLELENLVAKLRYLYHTPKALIQLEGIVKKEDFFYWLDQVDFRYFFLNIPHNLNSRQREIISNLNLLRDSSLVQDHDLLENVRQRLYFTVYLSSIMRGERASEAKREVLLWNQIFDCIDSQDLEVIHPLISKSASPRELLESCRTYAKETHSPILSSLQTIDDQFHPLRTID